MVRRIVIVSAWSCELRRSGFCRRERAIIASRAPSRSEGGGATGGAEDDDAMLLSTVLLLLVSSRGRTRSGDEEESPLLCSLGMWERHTAAVCVRNAMTAAACACGGPPLLPCCSFPGRMAAREGLARRCVRRLTPASVQELPSRSVAARRRVALPSTPGRNSVPARRKRARVACPASEKQPTHRQRRTAVEADQDKVLRESCVCACAGMGDADGAARSSNTNRAGRGNTFATRHAQVGQRHPSDAQTLCQGAAKHGRWALFKVALHNSPNPKGDATGKAPSAKPPTPPTSFFSQASSWSILTTRSVKNDWSGCCCCPSPSAPPFP